MKDNHLGGRNNTFFAYNFSDQMVAEAVVHNASASPNEIVLITNYTYDHQGRMLGEKLKMNDHPQVTTKAYEYNEPGDLLNTYMHGNATGQNFNQKVKNNYNIRGWLRKINNPDNLAYDLFGLELRYENETNTGAIGVAARYNGNIAQMRWNSKSDMQRGYGFEYDKLNRLTASKYAQGSNYNGNAGYYNTNYTYDENGNFANLTRKKNNVVIDNLTYTYYSNNKSNRLLSVNDQGTIEGYVPATGNYTYDANANMTHDPSKMINVAYNLLNLPRQITFGPDDNIQYAYTATGAKLRKTVTTMKTTSGSVTDYCGNFIYSDNQLITIFAGEVRVAPVNVGNSIYWKYEYSMKDHLGNVRVVFAAHSHGQPELLQQTSYYPFGMTMQQQNFNSQNATENKYLYNSKELQDDQLAGNSLDWYDYGARFYDATLGRWHVVDPLAEKYYSISTYAYVANNPMIFIDPDGMRITDPPGFQPSPSMRRLMQAAEHARKSVEAGQKAASAKVSIEGTYGTVGAGVKLGGVVDTKVEAGFVRVGASVGIDGSTVKANAGFLEGTVKVGTGNTSASTTVEVGVAQGSVNVNASDGVTAGGSLGYAGAKVKLGEDRNINVNESGEIGISAKFSMVKASVSVNVLNAVTAVSEGIQALGALGVFESLRPQIPQRIEE